MNTFSHVALLALYANIGIDSFILPFKLCYSFVNICRLEVIVIKSFTVHKYLYFVFVNISSNAQCSICDTLKKQGQGHLCDVLIGNLNSGPT